MVKKKKEIYYNPKTGQSTSDPLFAKKAGATTTEERRQTNIEQSNKEIALKNEQARLQGQKYYAGDKEVSRSEYQTITGHGGMITPAVEEYEKSQEILKAKMEEEQIKDLARKKVMQEEMEATFREEHLTEKMTPEQEAFATSEPPKTEFPKLTKEPMTFPVESRAGQLLNLGAKLPLAQAFFASAGIKDITENDMSDFIVQSTDDMIKKGLTPEEYTTDPIFQGYLRWGLTERDAKVLKSGEAHVTKLAGFIEALPLEKIPFLGPSIEGILGGITGTTLPKEQIDEMMGEVSALSTQFRDDGMMVTYNPNAKLSYLDQVEVTQDRLLDLQSKLKLIILQSADLQANPEKIDKLMSEVDSVLSKAEKAKTQIIYG